MSPTPRQDAGHDSEAGTARVAGEYRPVTEGQLSLISKAKTARVGTGALKHATENGLKHRLCLFLRPLSTILLLFHQGQRRRRRPCPELTAPPCVGRVRVTYWMRCQIRL